MRLVARDVAVADKERSGVWSSGLPPTSYTHHPQSIRPDALSRKIEKQKLRVGYLGGKRQ